MKHWMLKCAVLVLAVTNVIGAENMKREKYVPYKAKPDEVSLTNMTAVPHYDRRHDLPLDREFTNRLEEVLCFAEKQESLIRHMRDKGMVRTNYWNGMYSGSVVVESQNAVYRFIFKSALQQLQQVDVSIFSDKPYGKLNPTEGFSFQFHDSSDAVSGFSSGQGKDKVTLNFYPDGTLESCGLFIGNQYYRARWDGNGKILSQTKREVGE